MIGFSLRRASKCQARDARDCLDLDCPERGRFFPVPRNHAVNDHRSPGWYDPNLLRRKEIGDPIPGTVDYFPEDWDESAEALDIETMVLNGLASNERDAYGI